MSKFKKDGIKARAALAKSNTISTTIAGDYENDRQRFQALSQNMNVVYDSNNNVDVNGTLARITTLEGLCTDYENRIAELESRLANYEGHSHSYEDDNGTTVTTKTTSEVA